MSLVSAAWKGDLDRVKAAVIRGEDIDGRGSDGDTALHEACRHGHVDIVKYLLANGANTELKGCRNWTPLQIACKLGHVEVVKALFENGVDYNQTVTEDTIKDGKTPLQLSCKEGHVSVVQALFENGVDYNQTVTEDTIKDGKTPLQLACHYGHVAILQTLLDHGVDLNQAFNEAAISQGLTRLQIACQYGHVAILQTLLYHGVDLNQAYNEAAICQGLTPLQIACQYGHVAILQTLLDHGVDLNQAFNEAAISQGLTPLQIACRTGKVSLLQTFLDYGVDLNQPFNEVAINHGCTPLQIACQEGYSAIVQALLDHGVDFNQTFNEAAISQGVTPLQLAYQYGQDEVIETLFDHGMDTGYLMTVLKKGIRDRDVGITYLLRERMGISQEAIDDALFNASYQEALKDGSASNDRIPVMIIGQDRSGKTSLRKRLLGLPFDPNESSTVGIHVDLVRVTSETSKEPWQPRTDERILTSEDVAMEKVNEKAGMMLKQKTKYKQVYTAPLSSYNLKDTFHANQQSQQHHLPMDETRSVTESTCHQEDHSKQQANSDPNLKQQCSIERNATTPIEASGEQDQQIGNLASTTTAFNKQHMLISGVTAEPQLTDEIPSSDAWLNQEYTFATDVLTSNQQQSKSTRKIKSAEKPSRIEKELMTCYQDVNKDHKSDGIRILLHDLAGQAIYYDTHYLFLKSQAPYILVHDLTKDLDETAEPRFKPRFKVELNLANPLLQNNLDYLLCWLSVLGQLGETETEKSEDFSDFVLPPVVIVLTNEDQFEGDVEAVKRRIRDVTEGKYQNVFRNLYVIDNTTTSGNNDPVTALREKIFSLCEEILAKEPPMPLKWLKFEGALSEKAFSGEKCNYISIDKAKKIAKKCNIHSYVDALKFLHRQGVVVYYQESPYVVLNPSWLMNLFTEIITVPDDSENIKPIDAPYYRKLREKGVLMQKFLKKHPHGDLLENVMQRVSLMCPLKHEGKSAFLVPSVAPFMEEGKNIMPKLKLSPIASVFIRFLVGIIPLGVFTRFQVKLVKRCKGILRIQEPQLFCNYTLLPVKYSSINFDVYLIQLIEKIKIGVCPKDKVTNKKSLGKFACLLKNLLQECLEEIKTDEPLFYRGLAYEFCVRCTACADVIKKPCLRHDEIRCQHDECAHMRPLIDIQNCSSSSLCCDADKTKSLEFGLERVNPWLNTVSKDESSSKTGFVRRTIFKAVRKTPFNRHRSQFENEPSKSIGSRRDVEEKKFSHELSGKKKKLACESETMLQDDEIKRLSDDHESRPAVRDNEDNLLGNVSSCFNSLVIKQDSRVEILEGQESKQSRKRQSNTTDKEKEASTSEEYVTATEDRRQPAEKVSVKNLNALVMLQLGKKLDVKKCVGGDYRYLAAYFDMSTEDIDLISEKDDRTKEVLSYMGRDPTNTVSKLRKILVEMERDDCVAIIDQKYK